MSDPKELGLHMRYHHRSKRKPEPLKVSEQVDSIVDGEVASVKNVPMYHTSHFLSFVLQTRRKPQIFQRNIVK